MINSTFSMNSAANRGGGVYMISEGTLLTLINSTFSMNSALIQGGGVFLVLESMLTLRNSVFWNNTDTDGANGNETAHIFDEPAFGENVISVEYSCVQDNDPDDAGAYPGTGNIDDDPMFVDPANNDYHLAPGSPCIDAGDPNFVPQSGDTDIDGEPRVMGCRVDMGVDEMTAGQPNSGDLDGNGVVDLSDIPLFVNALLAATDPGDQCVADLNGDGNNDGLDIELFVALLLGGP